MAKKNQRFYTAIAGVVIVAALVWYFTSKPSSQNSGTNSSKNSASTSKNSGTAASGVWTGTLKKSDTTSKGNFMLVTTDRTIYFQTVRDLGSLVDKKVNLSYEGSLKGFTVLSVTAAQ